MTLKHSVSALALILAAGQAGAASVHLQFLGSAILPNDITAPDADGNEIPVGEISGLQMTAPGEYVGISDVRGGGGDGSPRFHTFNIDVDETGFATLEVTGTVPLRDESGEILPEDRATIDPEAIRPAPNGNFYISSEGNFDDDPALLVQPEIVEVTPEGQIVRRIPVPESYNYVDNATDGARSNRLLEALAVDETGTLFTGSEESTIQDGPRSSLTEGSVVRIAEIDSDSGEALAQYAYLLPPITVDDSGEPGLVDLLATGPDSFLALERAFDSDVGNFVSIVHTTITDETTDILGLPSLIGEDVTPMTREVILDLDEETSAGLGFDLDNLEAIAFGNPLANGNPTLILAADNNFNPRFQTNLFLAFEVVDGPKPIPLPAGLPLALAGLGALSLLRRRG